jgi:quercetin dioxygenase-like cupin family protein
MTTTKGAPENTSPAAPVDGYVPSPRPSYDRPTLVREADALRHIWGDHDAGHVADLVLASSEKVHMIVFVLPPGGHFTHSDAFRTVFAADELLHVLTGTMVIANPENGEVQRVRTGESVFFRRDTWHHAFAHGGETLRVLEIFAPPPATGASGAYARKQEYLAQSIYADNGVVGGLPGSASQPTTLRILGDSDVVWRRDLGVLAGMLVSTEHVTVHTLEVNPGECSSRHAHGGDEVCYVSEGRLWVRAWHGGSTFVFELGPHDACYLPEGAQHEYRVYDGTTAHALVGVAPNYLP